jgi:hypothetical protein
MFFRYSKKPSLKSVWWGFFCSRRCVSSFWATILGLHRAVRSGIKFLPSNVLLFEPQKK